MTPDQPGAVPGTAPDQPGAVRGTAPDQPGAATYAGAGVDIDAADRAVRLLAPHARSTFRPEVISDIGGFGAAVRVPAGYREPVLVSSTDGAGTKTLVAAAMGRFDTIGVDLVAMCADDIVCLGAEPLFMCDLITTGRVDPVHIEALVAGVAEGCRAAGCALVGGEIAEHPDAMSPGEWDIGGFVVGVVEESGVVDGPRLVASGDRLIGLHSPGLRCNGYSLARRVLGTTPADLARPAWPGAAVTVGDELLRPSVVYTPAVLDLCRTVPVHGIAHITGGGLAGNVVRMLGPAVDAAVDSGSWAEPAVFGELRRRGVGDEEMRKVFNLGIGMVVAVPADVTAQALDVLDGHGHRPAVIGEVVPGSGTVAVR